MPEDKPQLHASMLDTISRCGVQFQRRYGHRFGVHHKEEIIPPGTALIIGIATHEAVGNTLTYKMETGELPDIESVQEVARDSITQATAGEVSLTDEESENIKKTFGGVIDMTVSLASLHHSCIAPNINPIAVEEPFVIELKNYPIDLAGKIDCREVGVIRDTKTKGKTPPDSIIISPQMAMYSMARKVIDGKYPDKAIFDCLIKTKTPKTKIIEAIPNDTWIRPLRFRIERFVEILEAVKSGKQAFTPANPDDWMCSKKWCGYATTCPFWLGR